MASSAIFLAAAGLLEDVGQLLGGVQAGGLGGDVVPVDVSATRPETLLPLALASVGMFLYLQAIEAVGRVVAATLGVGSGLDPKRLSAKRERFCTAWGEMVYFVVQVIVSYRLFSGCSWYWPSGWNSEGRLGHDDLGLVILEGDPSPPVYHWKREMRAYYAIEFGWYSMGMVMLLFKKRRSDFLEMFAHHFMSSLLILMSYTYNYVKMGIVVMALHNLFDPFLNMAKCCHYAFKGSLHVLADVNFGIGLVVFLISRLVLYPVMVYTVWIHDHVYPGKKLVWDATVDQWICKIFLVLLFPLHLFWFYLILKVAMKALIGGTVQKDERSDSEDEDDEPDGSTAKQAVKDNGTKKPKKA